MIEKFLWVVYTEMICKPYVEFRIDFWSTIPKESCNNQWSQPTL